MWIWVLGAYWNCLNILSAQCDCWTYLRHIFKMGLSSYDKNPCFFTRVSKFMPIVCQSNLLIDFCNVMHIYFCLLIFGIATVKAIQDIMSRQLILISFSYHAICILHRLPHFNLLDMISCHYSVWSVQKCRWEVRLDEWRNECWYTQIVEGWIYTKAVSQTWHETVRCGWWNR